MRSAFCSQRIAAQSFQSTRCTRYMEVLPYCNLACLSRFTCDVCVHNAALFRVGVHFRTDIPAPTPYHLVKWSPPCHFERWPPSTILTNRDLLDNILSGSKHTLWSTQENVELEPSSLSVPVLLPSIRAELSHHWRLVSHAVSVLARQCFCGDMPLLFLQGQDLPGHAVCSRRIVLVFYVPQS